MNMKGQVALAFDQDMRPQQLRFTAAGGAGQVNAAGLYPAPLTVTSLLASGAYDIGSGAGLIDTLRLDLGGPKLEAQASVTRRVAASFAVTSTRIDRRSPSFTGARKRSVCPR